MIVTVQTLIYFRESLFTFLERFIGPYYKNFTFSKYTQESNSDDDDSDEQVFAEFDDIKGVVFFPPVYAQRYAAVSDCLMDPRWCGKLDKVVEFGYHDMSFIRYLKEVPGVKCILGVDIEAIPLRCSSDLVGCNEYAPKRENPLQITLFQGNAADPDYRLIGCDAVVSIEMIEHMLPQDLDRLVHTVFGFIRPWIAIFTTPNADFNILFKSLEKNGLRRMDHFFEWTREQFHDWCSNIVVRYPNYTVSCKGIGPGPSGTAQYGCCSQLALFISKSYNKQQDLNIDSMALVPNVPNTNNISDMESSWEYNEPIPESNMLCGPTNQESLSELEFPDHQSCMTIVLTALPSLETLEYQDGFTQCNLDRDVGRNYLMFDEDFCGNILLPRRCASNKVYEIEDVSSRLNCSTFQVKKFSKTTQNLLAKNTIDSYVHTRDVVDEIRQLTKMLNLNRSPLDHAQQSMFTWYNINWGENAPYWNQYYQIIRDYNYPFEVKSEDCRILELILHEINRLIDLKNTHDSPRTCEKLEIPIDCLMTVVKHITDDTDKVKDLLEWNGYEVVDDVVVYSPLIVENVSVVTPDDDWQDDETQSDWDTSDIHSTSYSNGSIVTADYYDNCLYRALDHKVRNLRAMVTADEDVTTELDRVVCRLVKLALGMSKYQNAPPPTSWLQCKLLDLLTLTEKSILRKKRDLIEKSHFQALEFGDNNDTVDMVEKWKENDVAREIMDKYNEIIQTSDNMEDKQLFTNETFQYVHLEIENDAKINIREFMNVCDSKNKDNSIPSPNIDLPITFTTVTSNNSKIKKNGTIVLKDFETDGHKAYVDADANSGITSSDNTDYSITNVCNRNYKNHKGNRKRKINTKQSNTQDKMYEKIHLPNRDVKNKSKANKSRVLRKFVLKKSVYSYFTKNNITSFTFDRSQIQNKLKHIKDKGLMSKPIPASLIQLCQPEIHAEKNISVIKLDVYGDQSFIEQSERMDSVTVTECCSIDNIRGNIASSHNIEVDADKSSMLPPNLGLLSEVDAVCETVIKVTKDDSFNHMDEVATKNVQSQLLFLYDINEPSTSKGVRHVNIDVQCGPDTNYTTVTTLSNVSVLGSAVKINNSVAKINFTGISSDYGTSIDDYTIPYAKTIYPKKKSNGIQIKDSDVVLGKKREKLSMATNIDYLAVETKKENDLTVKETKIIKSVSKLIEIEDSYSELCQNITCDTNDYTEVAKCKSFSRIIVPSKNLDNTSFGLFNKSNEEKVESKLTCGGILIHSYKNRKTCEDILYQGEWQRNKSKVFVKKNPRISIVSKTSADFKSKGKNVRAKGSITQNYKEKKNLPNSNIYQTSTDFKFKRRNVCSKECIQQKHIEKKYPRNSIGSHASTDFTFKRSIVCSKDSTIEKKNNHNSIISQKTTDFHIKIRDQGFKECLTQKNIDKKIPRNSNVLAMSADYNFQRRNKCSKECEAQKRIGKINKYKDQTHKEICPFSGLLNEDKVKQEIPNKIVRSKKLAASHSLMKVSKSNKSLTKVTSKVLESSNLSKNSRNMNVKKRTFLSRRMNNNNIQTMPERNSIKNYLPKYLEKRKPIITNKKSDCNILNEGYKGVPANTISNVSQFKNTRKDLLKFLNDPRKCIRFAVFRNEIESKNNSSVTSPSMIENNDKIDQPMTTISTTSSCSSSNSIATIRITSPKRKVLQDKKEYKISERNVSDTLKRSSTKSKWNRIFKKPSLISDNKENAPESSNHFKNIRNESSDTSLVLKNKNILMVNNNVPTNVIITSSSNVKNVNKNEAMNKNPILSKNDVSKTDDVLVKENSGKILDDNIPQGSNLVLILQTYTDDSLIKSDKFLSQSSFTNNRTGGKLDNEECKPLTKYIDDTNIKKEIIVLLEERLDNVISLCNDEPNNLKIDSNNLQNVISDESFLNRHDAKNYRIDKALRTESTVSSLESGSKPVNVDVISFKSFASLSGYSDYFLADNELSTTLDSKRTSNSTTRCVQDIFDRKASILELNADGMLATQVFSGFTMSDADAPGDQLNPKSLIDSETVSRSLNIEARRVNSEEVFVSGRSSDTFETCQMDDDDSTVPYWLFQVINQQHSAEEEEAQALCGTLPLPPVEPLLDENGNAIESVLGVSAGAGDGCGIHSDVESSEQDTSLSSTDTSEPQSQAILIDPSANASHVDFERESDSQHFYEAPSPDSFRTVEGPDNEGAFNRSEGSTLNTRTAQSDLDADISSLDTDIGDFSDN